MKKYDGYPDPGPEEKGYDPKAIIRSENHKTPLHLFLIHATLRKLW